MTENTAADDGDRATAMTQFPEPSGAAAVSVPAAAAAALPASLRVVVSRYLRLAAFGVAWTVLNMEVVDGAFEVNFRPPPYHIAQIFAPSR